MDNYYEILQVAPNAEPEVIAGAYTRLSKKYHPDLNASPEAAARMQAINAAYAVLRDPDKRAQYDRTRLAATTTVATATQQCAPSTNIAAPAQTQTKSFCVNHPDTETYLRCNKCGKPVCIKCVQRTPVGYRCNECLGMQPRGYYNATSLDYVLASIIAFVLGAVGGFALSLIGGFWIIAIFAGPIAGGIISEAIRRVISKRRGRYIALVSCIALVIGALFIMFAPYLAFILAGRMQIVARAVLNIGFWIFLALAVSTVYARLRI